MAGVHANPYVVAKNIFLEKIALSFTCKPSYSCPANLVPRVLSLFLPRDMALVVAGSPEILGPQTFRLRSMFDQLVLCHRERTY